jgi:hypothetical protein
MSPSAKGDPMKANIGAVAFVRWGPEDPFGDFNVDGEFLSPISIEVDGKSDAVITVRDRNRRMLYRLDPTERMTIVAKRIIRPSARPQTSGQGGGSRKPASTGAIKELPDGCEGAFSPYAQPEMANVIGRCVSELPDRLRVALR